MRSLKFQKLQQEDHLLCNAVEIGATRSTASYCAETRRSCRARVGPALLYGNGPMCCKASTSARCPQSPGLAFASKVAHAMLPSLNRLRRRVDAGLGRQPDECGIDNAYRPGDGYDRGPAATSRPSQRRSQASTSPCSQRPCRPCPRSLSIGTVLLSSIIVTGDPLAGA